MKHCKAWPEGVGIEIISDDSREVRDTLNSLLESIAEEFILTVIVLFFFLRNVKSTLIMAISIPFSVLITVLVAFTVLAGSAILFGRLRIAYMSNYNDTSVGLNVELPLGTKLSETQNAMDQFYDIVKKEVKDPENIVVSVGTTSGMSLSSDTSYKGSISIYLKDASMQTQSAEIKAILRKHFNDFPTATFTFDDGKMQQMTGSDIDIAFHGDNLTEITSFANNLISVMKDKLPSVTEAELEIEEGLPQVEIKIDRANLPLRRRRLRCCCSPYK